MSVIPTVLFPSVFSWGAASVPADLEDRNNMEGLAGLLALAGGIFSALEDKCENV